MESWSGFRPNPRPADLTTLAEAGRQLGIDWPIDYIAFMAESDGGEGWIGASFARFWSAAELVEMNTGYGFREFKPGLVAFGSDGGGEAFAFDLRGAQPRIVVVPFIGGPEDAIDQGQTLDELFARLRLDQIYRADS